MKRATRKVEKRTFTLKNAIPRFVSIVTRGANFTPLSELRYADGTERFSDVEINQIVFDKANFSLEGVEQYLQENDYEDFKIEETELAYVVPGVAQDEFEEVEPIEYGDGVKFYIGKLRIATETEQAVGEVTNAEVLDFAQEEVTTETTEEVVQEGDLTVEDLKPNKQETPNEEAEPESAETPSEESTEEFQATSETETGEAETEVTTELETVEDTPIFNETLFRAKATEALEAFFSALDAAKTESFAMPEQTQEVTMFSQEEVDAMIAEAVNAVTEQFADKNNETLENTIDETPILVQNSQAVNSEELTQEKIQDERTDKFAQRKSSDLFGLRN